MLAKTPTKPEVEVRKVGERVEAIFNIEPSTVKELGDGAFEAVITTSANDRHGESIATEGIDTANYMQNPVVLYGHDYEGLPIGKATKLTQFKNKIKAQFQLAVNEYPFAATIAALIKGGYLNATSIGGIVTEWSEDYKTILGMEMVEFSVVPVPANQEALMTSRSLEKITGKSVDEIRGEFAEFSHDVFVDKLSSLPQDEIKDAVKTLKTLTAHLEGTLEAPLADENKTHIRRFVLPAAKAAATQSQKVIKIIKLKSEIK